MEEFEKHLYDISVDLAESSKDDIHVSSELFKEVVRYMYDGKLTKFNLKYAIREIFRQCANYDDSQKVDSERFRYDYIEFWENIRKETLIGDNINKLKTALLKNDYYVGNKNYNIGEWTKPQSKQFLKRVINDYKKHYWINQEMSKAMEPFFIILFALKNIEVNKGDTLYTHKTAICDYKKHLNDDTVAAIDWVVDCCIELHLFNKDTKLFDDFKITLSGLMLFYQRFSYSKHVVKTQLYKLLKNNFQKPIKFQNTGVVITEIKAVSLIDRINEIFSAFRPNEDIFDKSMPLCKWLPDDGTDKGCMNKTHSTLKNYLNKYYENADKNTDLIYDILKMNIDVFNYYEIYTYDDNNPAQHEMTYEHFKEYGSYFIDSVVLLALYAPLDNYFSIIEYSGLSKYLRNKMIEQEYSFFLDEPSEHGIALKELADEILSRKLHLECTEQICLNTLDLFKIIYDNPQEYFCRGFVDKYDFWSDKTYNQLLLDIYIHIMK